MMINTFCTENLWKYYRTFFQVTLKILQIKTKILSMQLISHNFPNFVNDYFLPFSIFLTIHHAQINMNYLWWLWKLLLCGPRSLVRTLQLVLICLLFLFLHDCFMSFLQENTILPIGFISALYDLKPDKGYRTHNPYLKCGRDLNFFLLEINGNCIFFNIFFF